MGSKNEKGAIGLLVVMGVGFLALTGVLIMSEGVLSGLVAGQNTTATVRAFYASESATEEGISKYLEEISAGNSFSESFTIESGLAFAGGVELNEIEIEPIPGTFRFIVKGEAKSGSPVRRVTKMLTTYDADVAFDHALYSAGSGLTLGGNATVEGSVYSHGELSFNGNSAEINGDLYTFADDVDLHSDDSVDGNIFMNYGPVSAPKVDFNELKSATSSLVFTTQADAQSCINDGDCDNKVVYIDVDASENLTININPNNTFNGSIVTPGNLTIGSGSFIAPVNFPVIVTGGTLKINGGPPESKIKGVVIVGGDVEILSGNANIIGALLLVSETSNSTINGTVDIEFDSETFANITEFVGLGMQSNDISSATRLNWNER